MTRLNWHREGLEGHNLKSTLRLYIWWLIELCPFVLLINYIFGIEKTLLSIPFLTIILVSIEYNFFYFDDKKLPTLNSVPEKAKPFWSRKIIPFMACFWALFLISILFIKMNVIPRKGMLPENLIPVVESLETEIENLRDFFTAPTPQVIHEISKRNNMLESSKEIILALKDHKNELSEPTLKKAAFLAVALEDYTQASGFVEIGLKESPKDKDLLAIRGLIEYEQSDYTKARNSFEKALQLASLNPSNINFIAAMIGNQCLTNWALGQTREAEALLKTSLSSYKEDAKQQRVYLLLTQIDLYIDYGQPEKALNATNQALQIVQEMNSGEELPIYLARIYRRQSRLALFKGFVGEAKGQIDKAVKFHKETSSLLDLAQDLDVDADIKELVGNYKEALEILKEAEMNYSSGAYHKGLSENHLKQANVLIELGDYHEAQDLIQSALIGFSQLGYERGIAEAHALMGTLIQRRLMHNIRNLQLAEIISEVSKARAKYETALKTYRTLNYKRGIAYVQNKLGVNFMLIKKPEEIHPEEFSQAEQACLEAVHIYEEIEDKRGEGEALGNLGGVVYRKYGKVQEDKYQLGIDSLEKALEIHSSIKFKLGIGRQLFNSGRLYYELGDKQKSKNYFLMAKRTFIEMGMVVAKDEIAEVDKYLKQLGEKVRT